VGWGGGNGREVGVGARARSFPERGERREREGW
jgi:hypothetical protein